MLVGAGCPREIAAADRPCGGWAGAVARRGWAAPESGAMGGFLKEASTVAGQPNPAPIMSGCPWMAADLPGRWCGVSVGY